jgi:hypothetical protein
MARDDDTGFPAGFSGIDPEEMARLIRLLERGREDLAQIPSRWRSELAGFSEVDTSVLNRIAEVGRWVDEQLPQLERRRKGILDWASPKMPGLRAYVESKFASQAEARRYGQSLAARLNNIKNPVNFKGVLAELAANKYDPDVTAAFFAALGPEGTPLLPLKVNRGDNERRGQQINDISDAFGTAVSAGGNIDGFGKVRDAMLERQDSVDDVRGISKLVSHGRFAPDWLANVVDRQALDPIMTPGLEESSIHDRDGTAFTLFLRALGNNPAAARLAIGQYTGDYTPQGAPAPASQFPAAPTTTQSNERTLDDVLRKLTATVADGGAPAKEMGHVFAAASGATDEADGQHTQDAAWFAYNTMTTIDSGFQTRTNAGLRGAPAEIKPYLAQIAGSYATEITEGANIDEPNARLPSKFSDVNSPIPGLNPQFSLNARDTYDFMKTFADTDELMKPFDQGMSTLAERLKQQGVQIEANHTGGQDRLGMSEIMDSIGYVAGLEVAAKEQVRGKLDAEDERNRKLLQLLVGAESAGAGFAAPAGIAKELVWETMLYGTEQQTGQALDQLGEASRVDELNKEQVRVTLARHYDVVHTMLDDGYKVNVTPAEYSKTHPSIVDASGHLLPYAHFAKDDAKLNAYYGWLAANGWGGTDPESLGRQSVGWVNRLEGAQVRARSQAGTWE